MIELSQQLFTVPVVGILSGAVGAGIGAVVMGAVAELRQERIAREPRREPRRRESVPGVRLPAPESVPETVAAVPPGAALRPWRIEQYRDWLQAAGYAGEWLAWSKLIRLAAEYGEFDGVAVTEPRMKKLLRAGFDRILEDQRVIGGKSKQVFYRVPRADRAPRAGRDYGHQPAGSAEAIARGVFVGVGSDVRRAA